MSDQTVGWGATVVARLFSLCHHAGEMLAAVSIAGWLWNTKAEAGAD